jgi:hypothetical protein
MNATFASTAALAALFSGVLSAADPQLLNLVMPDVKVMADVNVTQAKASPFGQYVLAQMPPQQLEQIALVTGFDPAHDVTELLFAGTGASQHSGLVLALGNFNVPTISNAIAKFKAGSDIYRGVTIFMDPQKQGGLAFLSGTVAAAGDLVNLKAAIDRLSSPAVLPSALLAEIGQLSAADDVWALSTVPPASLKVAAISGLPSGAGNAFGTVQSLNGGVKFGTNVVLSVQAQADTAQDAAGIAGMVQFLVNMAQAKAADEPQVQALAKALTVTADGTAVNISLTVPSTQLQEMIQSKSGSSPHAHSHK